jgi:hypothetical protein
VPQKIIATRQLQEGDNRCRLFYWLRTEGRKTHINDFALVCANCHRMIHRAKPFFIRGGSYSLTSVLLTILEKNLVLYTSLDFGPLRNCNGPKSREQWRQCQAARMVAAPPA